jgi:hypothetical protein
MFHFPGLPRRVAGAAGLLACLSLPTACGRSIVDADVAAQVRGRVLSSAGDAVVGAEIRAQVLDVTCVATALPGAVVLSGNEGHYTFTITTFGRSEQRYCLRLDVVPPAGSGLAPVTTLDRPLILLPPPGGVLDVDIELPAAGHG